MSAPPAPPRLPPGYAVGELLSETIYSVLWRGQRFSDGSSVLLRSCGSRARHLRVASFYKHLLGTEIIEIPEEESAIVITDCGGLFNDIDYFFSIAIALAKALNVLHSRRVVHGLISPRTFLVVTAPGVEPRIVFIHWDGAIRFDEVESADTQSIWQQQTLAYISPEQTGQISIRADHRSDLYSLGSVLYHLCTGTLASRSLNGRTPNVSASSATASGSSESLTVVSPTVSGDDSSPVQLLHELLFAVPVPTNEVNPNVPVMLGNIIARLLAKQPEKRYQSAFGLCRDLEMCAAEFRAAANEQRPMRVLPLCEVDPPMMFRVSHTLLFGRNAEMHQIKEKCARTPTSQRPQCVLIEGPGGVGKTALLTAAVDKQHTLCVTGKCEEHGQHQPYGAYVQAFAQLVKKLLTLPRDELQSYRSKLQQALGSSSGVLVQAFPEMERLFGAQPSAPAAPELPTRFNEIILSLLRVVATPALPLVLIFDDMQWADSSSIRLWEAIVSSDVEALLVVGAFRGAEAKNSPLLLETIDKLKAHEADLEIIALKPLETPSISDLILSCVPMERESAMRLADILMSKTLGNPFFLIHYLKRLYDEELFRFDPASGRWVCNVEQVASRELAENAAALMTDVLAKLDSQLREPLLLASCFSGEFSSAYLAAAVDQPEEEMRKKLQNSVDLSLVFTSCPTVYKFCHDHVRSAAYNMLNEAQKQQYHLKIARLLQNLLTPEEQAESLFDLVEHLRRYISELMMLVELHGKAADKAVQSAAYATAAKFAEDGLQFLSRVSPDYWTTDHKLAFELTFSLAISLNWIGETDKARTVFTTLIAKSASPAQKADVYFVMIQYIMAHNLQSPEIWELAHDFCIAVGMPPCVVDPPEELVKEKLREAVKLLAGRTIESMERGPEDKELLPQRCLAVLLLPAWFRSPGLVMMLACQSITITLTRGINQFSGVGMLFFGWFAALRGVIPSARACALGQLALRIVDRYPQSAFRGHSYFMYGSHVHVLLHHPADCLPYLVHSLKLDVDTISFYSASFTAILLIETHIIGSTNLSDALSEAYRYAAMLHSPLRFDDLYSAAYATVLFWSELQVGAAVLNGPSMFPSPKLVECENRLLARKSIQPLSFFRCFKTALLYLLGRIDMAIACGDLTEESISALPGLNCVALMFYPFFILAELTMLARQTERSPTLEEKVKRHMGVVDMLCSQMSENLSGIVKLLQARIAEVLHRNIAGAAALYEEAITSIRERSFPLYEGVALSLAGGNAAALGMRSAAEHFYADACKVYTTFGATTLVAVLVRQHGTKVEVNSAPHSTRTPSSSNSPSPRSSMTLSLDNNKLRQYLPLTAQLDAYAVLQVTRTLSQEIVLDKLLAEVMRILIENAGADCAYLLLERNHGDAEKALEVVACISEGVGCSLETGANQLEHVDRNTADIVRYVQRLLEGVLLENAFGDARFTPPSRAYAIGVKSVLCLPLRAGKRFGVLYLENGGIAGAFTAARRELVEAIIPQIGISIEKASLVKELTEASEELSRRNQALQRADMHKDQFLAVTTHELRTPLHGIISATSLLVESSPLTDEQREYASVVLSASKSLLTLVEDILDLTRIRASKLRIEIRPFRVVSMVESVLEVLSAAAGEKGIDLEYEVKDDSEASRQLLLCSFKSDPARLQQVLTNLLSNAIKFTSRGYVLLTLSCEGIGANSRLRFEVIDTGVGIPKEKMPRLFQMFSQLDTPDPSRYDGYGVGLFICHSVVELLGGIITAESDGKTGSKFVVTVPAAVDVEEGFSLLGSRSVEMQLPSLVCAVWATYPHTEHIVANELRKAGSAVLLCSSAPQMAEVLKAHSKGHVCIVAELAHADQVRQAHVEAGKTVDCFVVLCSHAEWRKYTKLKAGLTPLFKPIQHKRIVAAVNAAHSQLLLPSTPINVPLAFRDAAGSSLTPSLLAGFISTPPVSSTPPLVAAPSLPAKHVILIVEDNVLNAKMLSNMLKHDYEVMTAGNGVEAIAAVQSRIPDLVLMDIQMPVMNGIAATEELRRIGFRMPIVAATASYSIAEREQCFNSGMTDVIAKPFTKQGVLAVIRRHMFTSLPVPVLG